MADYQFPAGDHDRPALLAAETGSFWDAAFDGRSTAAALAYAAAQTNALGNDDLNHLLSCVSRLKIPPFRRRDWDVLVLREGARGEAPGRLARYDGADAYEDPAGLFYGVPRPGGRPAWPAPPGLVRCRLIVNRIQDASAVLVEGVDFRVTPGRVEFRVDPFTLPVAIREVVEDNAVVDREAVLWMVDASYDYDDLFLQFGYALGLPLRSGPGAVRAVNAYYDALVEGGTRRQVVELLAAASGGPAAEAGERVERVLADARGSWVITDRRACLLAPAAEVLVAAGQTLAAGAPLGDAFLLNDLRRGAAPAWLPGLVLGRGWLEGDYLGELLFENADLPVTVGAEGGYTTVRFPVRGFPGDVEAFWDEVHRRGVAQGRTLAHALDTRPSPAGEPAAADLPASLNPLGFVVANLLRHHTLVARLRPRAFGPDAAGAAALRGLRRVVPPQASLIVVTELEAAGDVVTMDGPGDETTPGYEESVTLSPAAAISESIAPDAMLTETVRLSQSVGACG